MIEVKKLNKPTGGKPGFVTYTGQKTLRVTPDPEKIASMKNPDLLESGFSFAFYSAIKVSNPTFIISVKVFWRSSAVVSSSGLTKLSEIVMIARAST